MKAKPKIFLLILLLVSMLFINSGCNLLISIINDLQGENSYVSISPGNGTLMPGNSMQLTGRYYDSENDTEINITNSGEWKSSNTRVLSISYSGYLEALTVGTAEITLTYNDLTTKASFTVSYISPLGVEIYFEKMNYADPTFQENQDRLSNKVWITSGDMEGLYNAYSEGSYIYAKSPIDTEWAIGPTIIQSPENYSSWDMALDYENSYYINKTLSLHCISEGLWFDIVLMNWTSDEYGGGGGFAYRRTRVQPPGSIPLPGILFTKYDNTDTTSPTNIDQITPSVGITRGETDFGLINVYNAYETSYSSYYSPADTAWAMGPTSGHLLADYTTWEEATYGDPGYFLSETISLHVILENLWFDVVFLSWSEVGAGGFSYYRVQVDPPSGGELTYK